MDFTIGKLPGSGPAERQVDCGQDCGRSWPRRVAVGLALAGISLGAIAQSVEITGGQKISSAFGGFEGALDTGDVFGLGAARLGDIDGDGVVDIAVSAPGDDDGGENRGAVYILRLNADGTVKAEQKISSTTGGLDGPLDNDDRFGFSLAALGDLDGDGIGDLAAAANGDDNGDANAGAFYVLFLDSDGTVKAEQKVSATTGGFNGVLESFDSFAVSLSSIGDLDGDGVVDLVVGASGDDDGASGSGAVYVLFLNTNGTVRAHQKISGTAGGLEVGLGEHSRFGRTLAGVGDIDGNGASDMAVRAATSGETGVFIVFLKSDGTVSSAHKNELQALVPPVAQRYARDVSVVGDLDRNGVPDLAVTSTDSSGSPPSERSFDVLDIAFLGSGGRIVATDRISEDLDHIEGAPPPTPVLGQGPFFTDHAGLGDIDNDGMPDLLIGETRNILDDGGNSRGSAYVVNLRVLVARSVPAMRGWGYAALIMAILIVAATALKRH